MQFFTIIYSKNKRLFIITLPIVIIHILHDWNAIIMIDKLIFSTEISECIIRNNRSYLIYFVSGETYFIRKKNNKIFDIWIKICYGKTRFMKVDTCRYHSPNVRMLQAMKVCIPSYRVLGPGPNFTNKNSSVSSKKNTSLSVSSFSFSLSFPFIIRFYDLQILEKSQRFFNRNLNLFRNVDTYIYV